MILIKKFTISIKEDKDSTISLGWRLKVRKNTERRRIHLNVEDKPFFIQRERKEKVTIVTSYLIIRSFKERQ